jgi:hypothetical protein
MLRANQAVRIGLRAATRNPELAFGKALLDWIGNALAAAPLLFALILVSLFAADRGLEALGPLVRALRAVGWATAGGVTAALALSFVAAMAFWSGALPLLAADAEMDARPPPGNFAVLAARGFGRVLPAGLAAYGLSFFFTIACTVALTVGVPAFAVRRSVALLAGIAAVATMALVGGVLVDLLTRLMLVRAAAFGDGASAAFGHAASLLGSRLGACLVVAAAFIVLELVVATAAGAIGGAISSTSLFDPDLELLALAPRIALGLATAAVLSWLEVARLGALAALAADAEGLVPTPPEEISPPHAPMAEPVIEALPVAEE